MKVFESLEEALVRRKKYQAANDIQEFLGNHFTSSRNHKAQFKWIRDFTAQDWKGVTILHREVYLKEEVDTLEKLQKIQTLTEKEQKKLNGYREELQKVDVW
jgi:hypothetical protein